MRLRPGLSVLWRREGESQVGADPRCAVVLEDLTPAEQQILDHLVHDPTTADLLRLARVRGVPAERVHRLVELLERSGVLTRAPMAGDPPPGQVAYWSRLRPDGDGDSVVRRRAASVVAVAGLDRVGLLVAHALAAAGVGTLLLDDDGVVQPDDVAPYHPRDVKAPRVRRAADILRSTFPGLRTSAPPGARPDLLVAVSHHVADPVRLQPLVREDLPHLPVVVREVDVVVGPLVEPGRGPCARCLDLHRTDADAAWPAVATQLRLAREPGADPALAWVAASLAAHQVLAAVDGRDVVVRGASLEVDAFDPVPVRRLWTVHPRCGCDRVAAPVPVLTA